MTVAPDAVAAARASVAFAHPGGPWSSTRGGARPKQRLNARRVAQGPLHGLLQGAA